MKLLIVAIVGLMIIAPSTIAHYPNPKVRAEQLISQFLASKGSYMSLYFSDIDTAYTPLDDDFAYKELCKRVQVYEDSTVMFSRENISIADSFYAIYKKLNLQKDSFRIHYTPQPLGYLILHHFQFDGKLWTDSFTVDFNITRILKVKETIE